MVDLVFQKGTEAVGIGINGDDLSFSQLRGNYAVVGKLDGIQFSVSGILKEFPDLKDKEAGEMRKIAIERFRQKFRSFPTEREKIRYLQDDLGKKGYILIMIKRKGFRTVKVKNGIAGNNN